MSPDAFMRRAGQAYRWLAITVAVAYVLQVVLVTAASLIPYESRAHAGAIYEINCGFGGGFDYVPVLGAVAVRRCEPCRLVITDESGEARVKGYDLPEDVYEDNPDVWPEKQ